jgi:hypothetical protein
LQSLPAGPMSAMICRQTRQEAGQNLTFLVLQRPLK